MIDYDILESFGTDPLRLEAVFTASPGKPGDEGKPATYGLNAAGQRLYKDRYAESDMDPQELANKLWETRKMWEDRIQARLQNARDMCMRNYRIYMAADLAFEQSPLTPAKFAHMLYATGELKINFHQLYTEVKKLSGEAIADEMFIKDKQNPENIIGINTPKLTDITINLVRPYLRRAVAAQVNRYENLFPFLRYESRSQGLVGKLRADVVSERVEIMTDQYGYRHLLGQEIRGMFLHSHSASFVENSWSTTRQIHKIRDESNPKGYKAEERIEREGVKFKKAHPTRVFYDTQHPLSSINFDNGCQYCGFWDIVSFREVKNNSRFFNTQAIPYSSSLYDTFRKNTAYFLQYYATTVKSFEDTPRGVEANSRDANTEFYNSNLEGDEFVWLTHYYEKVIPKNEGLGGYPHPVWVHLIVAGDNTVVFAEILPSRPGYCLHYDENDDRLVNISMALDILPYQDQVSNLTSQMLYLLQIQNLLVLAVDADVVPANIRAQLKTVVEGRKLFDKVHLLEFESKIEELFDRNLSQKKPIQIFQAEVSNLIADLMRGITSTLTMLERNQMMSPNEMGQFVERETSATEVQQVSATSGDLHSYKSSGIDEARQAQKIILYESIVACGSRAIKISVPERYPNEVIRMAGFYATPGGYTQDEKAGVNLVGSVDALVGEFIFNSRDGAERTSNTESAKVLMELMRYIMGSEITFKAFVEAYGMEQVTKALSEVFRLAGSPMTLKLPIEFSEQDLKNQLGPGPEEERKMILQKLDELEQKMAQVEQVAEDYVVQQEQSISGQPGIPPGPPPQGMPIPQGQGMPMIR